MRTTLSVCLLAIGIATTASAQVFDSGSNGADGALDLTWLEPGSTFVLDPAAYDPLLDIDGDNVFHFTTITIPQNTTVRLRGQDYNSAPVYWLAQGDIIIKGKLELSGEDGVIATDASVAMPAWPGPGGYAGGMGASAADPLPEDSPLLKGQGPGGSFDHAVTTATPFLLPLVGGSGGGGCNGHGGGAGGGAILIATSTHFDFSFGLIEAAGGTGCKGGGGGSVRILTPTLKSNGSKIDVRQFQSGAGKGRIRLEAYDFGTGNLTLWGDARKVTLWPDTPIFAPGTEPGVDKPTLKVVTVAGQAVATSPNGDFVNPDVTIDSTPGVAIEIEASHVPVGTVVNVFVYSETSGATVIQSTPLAGTLAASTATANVTAPHGFTRIQLEASW